MQLRDYADDRRDQLRWKWNKGTSTTVADLKDPVNGSATYQVCLYDASGNPQPLMDRNVPPGGTCDGRPCWKATATGYVYRNKAGTPDGITSVKLRAGATGRARVQVKGRGADLQTPALPVTIPVTVQLVVRDALSTECWQTTFGTASRNDPSRFSAKGP